ncbi:MAG: hypothetical protein K2J04_05135, partial [Lachnospiraceae bacterium]|nr:hypothetical protein [Lachnospiraceae bacterium]
MNWRRIFAVMAVRVSMIAAVLFALMLIRAGALKEKEPKPDIRTAGIGVKYAAPYAYPYLFKLNHTHRLYFFPNEKKEAEAEVEESGNAIVLKKKEYINGNLREEYEYDATGNEVKAISYFDDGSIYTWYENEYDNKGNRIKHVSRRRNGDIAYEQIYEHNENGDVVKVCSYVGGSISDSEECEYDKDGNCTKDTVYYRDGSIREWSEYTYDEMGNKTKEIVYRGAGTDNIYSWCEYEYDEKGNETKRIGYSDEGSINYQYEDEYDEMGNVTKETYYNEYGMIGLWEEYEYDGMGNCTSNIRYKGDGTVASKRSYEYDEMGNRIKAIYFLPGSHIGSWEEYEYDEMGNKTKEIKHPGNSNDIWHRYEYKYDGEGREIRYTSYDYDGTIKECYESEYDGMGNLIKRSELKKGTGYHFNIFGELFVFKTMKEESVTEYEYEYASETAGQIRSTVIGEIEILEKSLQTNIEVEGWSRVRTWDLKYPYFSGDKAVLLGKINNQIYEWVQDRNMVDSEGVYYTE